MHEISKRDGEDSQKLVIPKNRTEHLETHVFQGASLSRFSLPIVSVPTIVLPLNDRLQDVKSLATYR